MSNYIYKLCAFCVNLSVRTEGSENLGLLYKVSGSRAGGWGGWGVGFSQVNDVKQSPRLILSVWFVPLTLAGKEKIFKWEGIVLK